MKVKAEILTVCEYANTSQDGKLNINGIFDEVNVQTFPGGLPRAFLVATIKGEPFTQYSFTLRLESMKINKSAIQPVEVKVKTGRNGKSNIVAQAINLTFPEAGNYEFIVLEGNEKIGTTLLKVSQTKYEPPTKPN